MYITDARPENRGSYLCEVENSAGQSYAYVVVEIESEFKTFIATFSLFSPGDDYVSPVLAIGNLSVRLSVHLFVCPSMCPLFTHICCDKNEK